MGIVAFTPPGGMELFAILAVVLVLFGGAKLPGFARSLGQAQREFRKGTTEELEEGASAKGETPKS